MKRKLKFLTLVIQAGMISITAGCASTGKSVGAGASAGALAGAGVGAIADPGSRGENRFRNVVIGTALGGAVGAGVGFMAESYAKDLRQESFEKGKQEGLKAQTSGSQASNGLSPTLLPARTEARWVPDQIRGNTFIPGHFEYVITEGARWSAGSR